VTADAVQTAGEDETVTAGEGFGRTLAPGAVVLLYGQLGAGKTAFVRGLARGLGAAAEEVSSPTFTIIQEYAGPAVTLYHVDLYRLDPPEVDDLGLEELIGGEGIVAIEWADRWRGRPDDAIEVTIEDRGDDRREIRIRNAPRPSI
jgi:tRNA threonylcarbamoyladenosine biosynthesis protein TsaE